VCGITRFVFSLVNSWAEEKALKERGKMREGKGEKYTIGWINLYPEKDVEELFKDLAERVEKGIKDYIQEKGEIQTFSGGKGENIDLGIRQALLLNGKFFEVYCFDCFSISFIRVWIEESLVQEKKKWISVDVDEILNSIWFE
jgi:hypothetical protein